MAILNKIRQRSLFLILIIALALFSFVLSGLFQNGSSLSGKSQNIVATINGKEISREDFLRKVEFAQRQMGASATNTQAMNRVWEQEVRQAVMESQYEKLGFTVERDQMRQLLKANLASSPEFQNEAGLFDENKLNEYIANLKATSVEGYQQWVDYEQSIADSGMQQDYVNMVKAGVTGTLAEGKVEYDFENNKVDIKYVQLPYSSISDSTVTVTKDEISSYIKNHSKGFEVEASRDINYVEFKEVASLDDEIEITTTLTEYLGTSVVYNDITKSNDTVLGFAQVKDTELFVNGNSDIKYDDRFVFKSGLTKILADSLFNKSVNSVYGPYKDNGYLKLSKLVAETFLPDSAKARHILIPFIGSRAASAETVLTEIQAKITADSVMTVVMANPSKFVDMLELSADKVSNENEGVLDWFTYNSMVPEFRDYTFENSKGDVGVVKTDFGYHVIEILDQTSKEKAVKIATIARAIEPSDETVDKVFRDASKFEIAVANNNFQEVAKENNYAVRPVKGIGVLQENIPGLSNQRQIVRWTFNEETKVGDVKRFNIPGGYAIVQVSAKTPAGLMSVENASAIVIPKIRKEKKAVILKKRVQAGTLDALAAEENQTIKTASSLNMKNPTISGAGREPVVVGAAFGLKEGETSKLIVGENGVYMVEVTKVSPAAGLDNYQAFANRVGQQKDNAVNTKLFTALKDASDIEDNRAESVQ
ncbi:SurA N-terminal domain-containing protein [Formosa sp. PL04]|uniref:peptidylprolyl isomerase n=1 Tax=Formosa sp. PL04 TaxID=3081755 RepID=UPI002980EB13|nr:SurA N-terminal domain-containing protein [Formosa sp. PL04]MDW5287933.1 SurA N-terminal domain-containing protein [Formosa sp. PL04]